MTGADRKSRARLECVSWCAKSRKSPLIWILGPPICSVGPGVAKVDARGAFREDPLQARLVLVSAINPTPAGEGKTTCVIGLTQAARRLGVRAACALREPSLGPVFGAKGGGTGGGRRCSLPADRINLHFTGDLHAVDLGPQPARRARRQPRLLRTPPARRTRPTPDGVPPRAGHERPLPAPHRHRPRRQDDGRATRGRLRHHRRQRGHGHPLPRQRLRRSEGAARPHPRRLRARRRAGRAHDLRAEGAMAALLRDAMLPNLVQTDRRRARAGAWRTVRQHRSRLQQHRRDAPVLRRADVVFTEAGFGFDLGAEKFLDIKCRVAGIWPHAVVLGRHAKGAEVPRRRASGRVGQAERRALARGMENLRNISRTSRRSGSSRSWRSTSRRGHPTRSCICARPHARRRRRRGRRRPFGRGGEGALALAEQIAGARAGGESDTAIPLRSRRSARGEDRKIAHAIYGADDVDFSVTAKKQIERAVRSASASCRSAWRRRTCRSPTTRSAWDARAISR